MSKEKLIELLNKGLELEHQARAQYLSHATLVSGESADGLATRLKEIAADEIRTAFKRRHLRFRVV